MENGNGDYGRLPQLEDVEIGRFEGGNPKKERFCSRQRSGWMRLVLLGILVTVAAVVLIFFAGSFLMHKVVIPILDWETATFSRSTLALLLFVTLATFPSLVLPSAPSMWLAGVAFGYGYGFVLIMAGISIGMSLPFFIGSLFRCRIHKWLEKCPDKAAFITLAGEGNWFHQFRAVALIRISPFPYILFNYAAVATNVKYSPYIAGSLAGTVHEIFLTIYSGTLIWSWADAANKGSILSAQQLVFDTVGLCATIVATIIITVYARRALRDLQARENQSLLA